MSCKKLLFSLSIVLLPSFAVAQLPVFVTQTPTTGNSGRNFFVFLPVSNVGTAAAENMQLTSVALTSLGTSVATTTHPSPLPFQTGSGYLAPGGLRTLDLEFDNSSLVAGNRYLVKATGTYDLNGTKYGFVLNRPVKYSQGFAASSHQQVMDVIAAKFTSLPRTDPQADDQELLNFVIGLPQISTAGLDTDDLAVWAHFADDDQLIVILNNRQPSVRGSVSSSAHLGAVLSDIASSTRAADSAMPISLLPTSQTLSASVTAPDPPTELPKRPTVRLLNTLGPSSFGNPIPQLHSWLESEQHYFDIGGDATVAGLRKVGGDGVFFLSTHGGASNNPSGENFPYILWTSSRWTLVPDPNDPLLKGDIADGDVVPVLAAADFANLSCPEPRNGAPCTWKDPIDEWHWAITPKFVSDYWGNFGENAFVFLSVCNSDNPFIILPIFRKLASVYGGYAGCTPPDVDDSTLLTFDRLLGANHVFQETEFNQRPFDYTQVVVDLPLHGLNKFLSKLAFRVNPDAPNFGLLAPSISNITVDETKGTSGQLTINGIFGQNPGPNYSEGFVTIGSPDFFANIESWDPNKIVVDLTPSGPGSAGDVQVDVRGHKSNVARLTDWRGNQFTYTELGDQSLKLQTVYTTHFRADIRRYRKAIHFPPDEPSGAVVVALDSTADYQASGSTSRSFPHKIEIWRWDGSGNLTAPISTNSAGVFAMTGRVNNSTQIGSVTWAAFAAPAWTCFDCTNGTCSTPPPMELLFGPSNEPGLVAVNGLVPKQFTFKLDGSATIEHDFFEMNVHGAFCAPPTTNGQPNLDLKFEWGPLPATADTAPEPNSAR
jgi:hypothetical protein